VLVLKLHLLCFFSYGQNDAIAVDSNVVKCAISLNWVPEWAKSPNLVRLCLQTWVPRHLWLHVNMVLASFSQLFSTEKKALLIKEAVERDVIFSQHLLPMIQQLLHKYQPQLFA